MKRAEFVVSLQYKKEHLPEATQIAQEHRYADYFNPTFHVRENCCQNFSLQWVSAQFSLQSPLKQNLREIRQLLVVFRVYRNSSSENCDKRGKSG